MIRFFIFIFLIILQSEVTGQNWVWAKDAPGNNSNDGRAVCTDVKGNVYVTGSFDSPSITFGNFVLTTPTLTNAIYIVKYDKNGNVLWAQSSAGMTSVNTRGEGICVDANGNVFVTGCFEGATITFGSHTVSNAGGTWVNGICIDLFVVKYSSTGTALWAASAGGTYHDFSNSISADASGNVYITGSSNSQNITFGTHTLNNIWGGFLFVVKYSPNGNVLWAQTPGKTFSPFWWTSAYDAGAAISTDPSGNIFVTGSFESQTITFGSFVLNNSSADSSDIFIVKYDPSGNVLWAKSMGGIYLDVSQDISTDINGDVFITGNFRSSSITFGGTTLTNASNGDSADIFIAKYSASGNAIWARRAGGTGDDGGSSVSTDKDGDVYLAGEFFSPQISFGTINFTSSTITYTDPVFVVKYDSSGNPLCGSALASGGGLFNYLGGNVAIAADSSGNAYLTGAYTIHPFAVGTNTLVLTNQYNMFVAKYTCCANFNADVSGPINICAGQNATFSASGGQTYLWNTGATTSSISVSPTSTTTFSVTIPEDYGCDKNLTATILVDSAPPTLIITGNSTLCAGQSTVLSVSGGGAYTWSNGAFGNSIVVSPLNSSTYSVTASNGCGIGAVSIAVMINQPPVINVWSDTTVIQGQVVTLSASGNGNFIWSNGGNGPTITISPTMTTQYCATITDSNNCISTACAMITVEPCGELFMPNAFSPNEDGENDVIRLYFKDLSCLKSIHVAIFNRWGEQIFESSNPEFYWDGTYKNRAENSGVFSYYIAATFFNDVETVKTGNITLLR